MCHAVPKAIWSAAAASSRELVGDAHQLPRRAGELLGVAAGGAEADEARREAERLAAGAAVAARRRTCPSGSGITRSPTCQPSTPSPSAAIRPTTSTPRTNGSSTGKRETPSRTSTSRWLSAHARDVDQHLARARLRIGDAPRAGGRRDRRTRGTRPPSRSDLPDPLAADGLRLCLTFGGVKHARVDTPPNV